MTLEAKVKEALARLTPKLDDLAEGYVELERVDEAKGAITIKLFGGRLH